MPTRSVSEETPIDPKRERGQNSPNLFPLLRFGLVSDAPLRLQPHPNCLLSRWSSSPHEGVGQFQPIQF